MNKLIISVILIILILLLILIFRYRNNILIKINKLEKNNSPSYLKSRKKYEIYMEDEYGNTFLMNEKFRVTSPLIVPSKPISYKKGDIIHPSYYNELILGNNQITKKYKTINRNFYVAHDVTNTFVSFLINNKLLPIEFVKYQQIKGKNGDNHE